MRHDKQTAVRLRLQGRSYSEIQTELGHISKSTLSLWLKDIVLSDASQNRLRQREYEKSRAALIKRNRRQTALALERKQAIRTAAQNNIQVLSPNELLLVGAALYWAEGYKRPRTRKGRELTHHEISFTNSDPQLLKMFLRFANEICCVPNEEIKVNVRIFEHLNEERVLNYWSETLSIPRANFEKTYLGISKSSMGKRPFNRLPYGTVQIRINDTNLFHKIMGWIDGLKNQS